jgi:chromosome partitioning protein
MLGRGLGVTEFEPNGKAAREIRDLWKWVNKKLEKVNERKEAHVA